MRKQSRGGAGIAGIAFALFLVLFDHLTKPEIITLSVAIAACLIFAGSEFPKRGGPSPGERIGRWMALVLFWSIVATMIGRYFITQSVQAEETETQKDIQAHYSMPSDRLLGNAKFTITNGSPNLINVRTIGCDIRVVRLDQGSEVRDVYVGFRGARLHPFGDSQSINCPSNSDEGVKLPSGAIKCGDVLFTVTYALDDDPRKDLALRYRYLLYENEHEWTPIPISYSGEGCSGTPQ